MLFSGLLDGQGDKLSGELFKLLPILDGLLEFGGIVGRNPLTEVGALVPDLVFEQVLNYPKSSLRFSDFKGKAIMLDFWATTCTSCIAGFPKLNAIQDRFGSKLQVLLVNSGDSPLKAMSFYERRKSILTLPVIYKDSLLKKNVSAFSYSISCMDRTGQGS